MFFWKTIPFYHTLFPFLNITRIRLSKFAVWSVCVVAAGWAVGTLFLELSWGIPQTPEQWAHRTMGWFVQFVLVRTFLKGFRRYASIAS